MLATFLVGCGAVVGPSDARTDGRADATPDGAPPPPLDGMTPPPIDVVTPPPPPIDGGVGCRTPDGRVIAPGTSFSDGCNTCTCQPDGSLACTGRACLDGGPPPDMAPPPPLDGGGLCRAPDGRVLGPGEVWSDRCATCFCLPDGSGALECRGTPCLDGGPPPDITPPPPPPPIDGGGVCRAPDGRVLAPGEFWSDACTTCVCAPDGSGLLRCESRPCVDGGPPPPTDGGVCFAPDGTVLRPGESWFDRCTECFCDATGALSCRTFCDGGLPPPPIDAGPACNTISLAGVAAPTVRTAASLPAMTGGAITDGRYELTEALFVAPPGVPVPRIGPFVMEFAGGVIQLANAVTVGGFEQHLTYWFMASGVDFTLVPVCGASSMPTVMRYTASATQLLLQVDSGGTSAQLTLLRR